MPLYEFSCDDCQQTVEVLVRSQSEQPTCPTCGSERLHKEMSVPASPSVRGGQSLPVSGGESATACDAPRCCGGGCQF